MQWMYECSAWEWYACSAWECMLNPLSRAAEAALEAHRMQDTYLISRCTICARGKSTFQHRRRREGALETEVQADFGFWPLEEKQFLRTAHSILFTSPMSCRAGLPCGICFIRSVWTLSHSFHSLQRLLVVLVFFVVVGFCVVVFCFFVNFVLPLLLCMPSIFHWLHSAKKTTDAERAD